MRPSPGVTLLQYVLSSLPQPASRVFGMEPCAATSVAFYTTTSVSATTRKRRVLMRTFMNSLPTVATWTD